MESFVVEIASDLGDAGSTKTLSGKLDESFYQVGSDRFDTPDGVEYDLILTNAGEGILLSGLAKCTAQTTCNRCLEPVEIDIAGEVEGYYLLQPAQSVDGYEDDEFETVAEDGTIDVSAAIEAALVFDTPFVIVCKDDCKGLCPHCGSNLNDGPCKCDEDDIDPLNPFAALKDLKFD